MQLVILHELKKKKEECVIYIKLCEVFSFPAFQLLNLCLSIHVKGECDVYLCIYSCIQTLIKNTGS